jgi:alkanesulfonate monooxygenase SsuD/methylene tetrahydromethanopterin reductase-like flavin-dependent oxidoreductase (luciferase family)
MPERLRVGVFIVPGGEDPAATVEQITTADRAGLDLVGVQDHPYQRRFLDTWTLLSYAAARTERITLVPDVINLPLRQPAVLAKSAASLDVLSGGRVELGLGAGAFWDGVAAMGGPRRTPGESVSALEEAIGLLRAFFAGETLRQEGEFYSAEGGRPGPAPAHPIGLWLGAYGPRMLRLTGRLADGWLPSIGSNYMSEEDAPDRQGTIDEAARRAGRDPSEIVRAVNAGLDDPDALLDPERLARIATELRFDAVLVSVPGDDPIEFIRRLGQETAPRARELASESG